MSVLKPLGFVFLKLHYTPKHTSNTGVPTQKLSVFSVRAKVWVVVFTLYQTLKKQLCFDCQNAMPRLSGLDSCPVTRSFERLQSLTPTLWTLFFPACLFFPPSLSLFLSISLSQQWASRWAFRQVLFPTLVITHSALTAHLTLCGSFSQATCKELWKC